jgi:hypothetical protein
MPGDEDDGSFAEHDDHAASTDVNAARAPKHRLRELPAKAVDERFYESGGVAWGEMLTQHGPL